jgi:hypothetical protein
MTTKTKRVNKDSRNQINLTPHPTDGLRPHRLHPPSIRSGNIHSRITATEQAAAYRGIDAPEKEEV